jgi:hypothetical protein
MEFAQPKGISNRTLNKAAALLHLGQAVAVLCIVAYLDHRDEGSKRFFKGEFRLYKQVAAWHQGGNGTVANSNNYTITMESHDVGALDVRYAIFAFFLLSALFQGYASYWSVSEETFQDLSSDLRYVEYAVSASVMLLCIAVETAVVQIYTLVALFALSVTTMLLGRLAQECFELAKVAKTGYWLWLFPHLLGWVTCVTAYAPVLDSFVSAVNGSSELKPPTFVYCIVALEFALFVSFGGVQLWELWSCASSLERSGWVDPSTRQGATRMFIYLSLIAKTLLGWLILSPILADAR